MNILLDEVARTSLATVQIWT